MPMETGAGRTLIVAAKPTDEPGPKLIELVEMFAKSQLMDEVGAAAYLGITINGVRQTVKRGRLPAVLLHTAILFVKSDLDAYIESRGSGLKSKLGAETVYRVQYKENE